MHDALIKFIEGEVDAEEREILMMHRASVAFREKNGHCITGLKFKGVDEDGLFIYSYAANQSKFRAGDLLVINEEKLKGEEVLNNGVLVWLEEIDYTQRLLKVEKDLLHDPPRANNCIADKGFFDYNSERLKHAICLAYEDEEIVSFLEGRSCLRQDNDFSSDTVESFLSLSRPMTERQMEALHSAMSNRATFIQGPPGSGKTFLLAEIIERSMSVGRSVLVTAPTHKAIDNLLLAAVKILSDKWRVIKIRGKGKPPWLSGRILQITVDDGRLCDLRAPYLVGSTIYQAYKFLQNSDLNFDIVVIDEASQMPIAHAVPALLNASRYVVAGDHRQLPPVLKSSLHPEPLKKSVFEYLHEKYADVVIALDITFRMNKSINEFPSRTFYEDQLRPSKCAADRVFVATADAADDLKHIICRDESVTYVQLDHRDAIQQAPEEAELVARIARSLLVYHKLSPESLAVVSPHRAHNEAIREKFLQSVSNDARLQLMASKVVVDTVERLQGQERDAIIYSLCASNRQYAINRAQFLYSPNRLNVAITRSRTRLFLVGSKFFFPHLNGIVIDARLLALWESYYNYLLDNDCIVVQSINR